MSATKLYAAGFTDLISVLPPDAEIAPTSKIAPAMRGKVPGYRGADGLWRGYDWRRAEHTLQDAAQWEEARANVGLRAAYFPAVDIDCSDPAIAQIVEGVAQAHLGPAPVRIGNPPKRLLPYRTEEPFTRMRVSFASGEKRYLVEVLGDGQQFLVEGMHPSTRLPYTWSEDLAAIGPEGLTLVTRENVQDFLTALVSHLEMLGYQDIKRAGDGVARADVGAQDGLLAPSFDALEQAVALIPNSDELFPDREDYLKIGYAIKAAGATDEDRAQALFCSWAARHTGSDRVAGNPETPISDWRRMLGPFAVGWSWIAELARPFGFNVAEHEFDAIEDDGAERESVDNPTQLLSQRWCEEKIVAARIGELRYVPAQSKWLVWDGVVWVPDSAMRAEEVIKRELSKIADVISGWGADDKERGAMKQKAIAMETANNARQIRELMHSNGAIALRPEMLDRDSMIINTPAGPVDLTTGQLRAPNPDDLCTRITAVAPKAGPCPRWMQFLGEVTQGDEEMINYLQRLCGYCLTGHTDEQQLAFFWGPGGNGKGIFINHVLAPILKDYAVAAQMDTFTATTHTSHPTELAMLAGARLVTASETESGKRWAEARLKAMTGGDPITAHFMGKDNFTFTPQFKLIFLGNHKPEIRNVDAAMRRRVQLVPFTFAPPEVDGKLGLKLQAEWPQIFAWMIEGCLLWQEGGLQVPKSVRKATDEYFTEEDPVGRWMMECCDMTGEVTLNALVESWREWSFANGEYQINPRRLTAALVARKLDRWTDPETRRPGFKGISLAPRNDIL